MESRKFHVKHYLDLDLAEQGTVQNWTTNISEELLYAFNDYENIKTIFSPQGHPIMVIGAVPLWMNVCEVFVLPGRGWHLHSIGICREIKKELKELTQYYHRVQAVCLADDRKYSKFLEMFGFEYEGDLRKYDARGRDYKMYSILGGD